VSFGLSIASAKNLDFHQRYLRTNETRGKGRTVRRWVSGERAISPGIAILIRLLLAEKISPDNVHLDARGAGVPVDCFKRARRNAASNSGSLIVARSMICSTSWIFCKRRFQATSLSDCWTE
jgi:hypothetical protein